MKSYKILIYIIVELYKKLICLPNVSLENKVESRDAFEKPDIQRSTVTFASE